MSSPLSVHHINFIVADLEASVKNYQAYLGLGPFEFEDLPKRGAQTARIKIGDMWLVLVSPLREDTVPGQYLKQHGEGFFLLSFGVADLDKALATYEARGALGPKPKIRRGLMDWRVTDLQTEAVLGAKFHLTEITPNK